MHIVVCIKQVIDTAAVIRIQDGKVQDEGLPRVLNPYDEFAIEEAVKIKEQNPETVITVVTLGPDKFKDALKSALAMGADKAIHLMDPIFDGLDSLGVAHALAKTLRTLQYDLVLCGRQAVDDDMAQVGPSLAVLLGLPYLSVVTKLELADDLHSARVTRQIEGGSEVYELPLPCLLTCQKGLNQPRLPSLKGIMAAKKKEVVVMDAAQINFDPESFGPGANRLVQVGLSEPPERKKGLILEGTAEETTARLVQILRDEVKVI